MGTAQGQIQSLDRAFALVEIIAKSPEPMLLKNITKEAGLPKPTVYRILSSLEAWGYVEQDKNKGYHLGIKFLQLGTKVQERLDIRTVARPYLKELNEITKETVFLGILDRGRSLYVDKLESHHSVRLASQVGSRNYLHSTSLGKCLLSESSEEEVEKLLAEHGMPQFTSQTITDKNVYLKQIKEVCQKGYAIDDMENEEGVRCVSAPIKNHKGKVVAAISISGPIQRITPEYIESALKPALLATAKEVSWALGYQPVDGSFRH